MYQAKHQDLNLQKIAKTTGFQPQIPHSPLASYIFIKKSLFTTVIVAHKAKIVENSYKKYHYCNKTVLFLQFLFQIIGGKWGMGE